MKIGIIFVMIALLAITNMASAIDSVKIDSPSDWQKFKLGEEISVRVTFVDNDGNCEMLSTLYVDGEPSSSRFVPDERGLHTIMVEVVDSYDGTTISDSIQIRVVGNAK